MTLKNALLLLSLVILFWALGGCQRGVKLALADTCLESDLPFALLSLVVERVGGLLQRHLADEASSELALSGTVTAFLLLL